MKKRIAKIALLCLGIYAVLLVVLYFAGFVEIRTKKDGNCTTVAFFEKQKVAGVDKVVIKDLHSDKQIIITEKELVGDIVEEAAIAPYSTLAVSKDVEVNLYKGDRLVRSMVGDISTGTIIAYQEDILHWILELNADENMIVCLSHDLTMTLWKLWNQINPNS